MTTSEAVRILVHYIELALGDRVKGDMKAELGSVVDAFDMLDREMENHQRYLTPIMPIGARR